MAPPFINETKLEEMLSARTEAEAWFISQPTKTDMNSYGIAGSTFRAYRGFDESPSKTYRKWAKDSELYLQSLTLPENNRGAFLQVHKTLESQLREAFKGELSHVQRFKLLDLFIKHIAQRTSNAGLREYLLNFGNIPLDKFSLKLVGSLFYGVVLSKSPSMGDVGNEENYRALQHRIFELTSSQGYPNLYFDHFAWNLYRERNNKEVVEKMQV